MRSSAVAEPTTGATRATRTAGVLGLGHHLPETIVSNLPIAQRLGIEESWIVKRTGIHHRRHAMPSERLSDLAIEAGRAAVKDAGVDPDHARRGARRHHLGRRDHAQRRALRRHCARGRARQRVRRRRRLHRVRDRAQRRHRADRERARGDRAGDRRRCALALHRLRRQALRRAVRRRRRRRRARGPGGRRRGRAVRVRVGRLARRGDHRPPRGPGPAHGRSHDLQRRRGGARALHARGLRARGRRARRRRPLRLPPGQRAHHARRLRAARPAARARRRLHRRDRQHLGGLDPAGAHVRARGGPAAARRHRAARPPSAPASPGAPRVVQWGGSA